MGTTGGKLSAAGAVLVMVCSLLPWTTIPLGGGYAYRGTMLSLSVFYKWDSTDLASSFLVSAGMLVALMGLAGLLGVLLHRSWLTWVSGGAAVVALGLPIIRFMGESDPDLGLLAGFMGGILVLVGAFLNRRADDASSEQAFRPDNTRGDVDSA